MPTLSLNIVTLATEYLLPLTNFYIIGLNYNINFWILKGVVILELSSHN